MKFFRNSQKNQNSLILIVLIVQISLAEYSWAGVGDPQIRTDHPWYPGELACSTFPRLFATQTKLYERVTGRKVTTDQDKALAAWLWRNTHYWHGEEGAENLWGKGFRQGGDLRTREYWTGLFAHGFGLCGTTHCQWVAEMEALFGHNRSRAVGTAGHSSFEVFLKGGPYGKGQWALLDHDISTVLFNGNGSRLLSIAEVQKDWKRLTDRNFNPKSQQGWLVCGLHPRDGGVYSQYRVAEYLAGYSGPPPMVHLRRGEKLRRYFRPGLADGNTFVFWGRNYNTAGIPGPERSRTWVNQPEKMFGSKKGTPHRNGQARFANAVYIYQPNFTSGDYQEGVISEGDEHVTFEFYTPYIIAATPPNANAWGIYDKGCRNGLTLHGKATCNVSLSTDQGSNWEDCGAFVNGMDLTDLVKGHRQYFLRFHTKAKNLRHSNLKITTVCQANSSILPRLKDNGTKITYEASGQAIFSAGPNLPQAQAHVVSGKFGTDDVVMKVATPRKEKISGLYAAAHIHSGSPPRPGILYKIDFSLEGKSWKPVVRDWEIVRRGNEPKDFWSQSFCWGSIELKERSATGIQVRFHNSGRRRIARAETHVVYRLPELDATRVTFHWTDNKGGHEASHVFEGTEQKGGTTWVLETGRNVETKWVEYEPVRK